jgi:L-lactate dehydrogenase complex protein LldG
MDEYTRSDATAETIFSRLVERPGTRSGGLNNELSRARILARVRAALGVTSDPARDQVRADRAERERLALPRQYRQTGLIDEAERIALFDERLRHYNGTPYYSRGNIPREIAHILTNRGKRIVIIPPQFPNEWLPEGFMFIPDDNLSYEQLNSSDGVISGCTLAIALTGTVVIENSPQQGRRAATLIPDYHLCVLRMDDIVEFVPEAIRRLESVKHQPLTFASGPSATVDIEMTRVRGVHGPRTLDVLVI